MEVAEAIERLVPRDKLTAFNLIQKNPSAYSGMAARAGVLGGKARNRGNGGGPRK